MSQGLSCPHCGANLEYAGQGRTMRCPYCGTSVDVPEGLWGPVEAAETSSQWKKYLILFLILTVGLPTCLGLLGAVLGIGSGILAAILPFALHLFAR